MQNLAAGYKQLQLSTLEVLHQAISEFCIRRKCCYINTGFTVEYFYKNTEKGEVEIKRTKMLEKMFDIYDDLYGNLPQEHCNEKGVWN